MSSVISFVELFWVTDNIPQKPYVAVIDMGGFWLGHLAIVERWNYTGTSVSVPTDIGTTTEASSLDCHFCGVDSPPVLFKDQKNEKTKTPLETRFDSHTHTHRHTHTHPRTHTHTHTQSMQTINKTILPSTSISCERVAMDTSKSQFYFSFWRSTSISCEGLPPTPHNRNFTSVFDARRPFRAKGLRFAAVRPAPPPP